MNTLYLIDLENVQSAGLEGVEYLTEDDYVLVFYSNKADNLKIDLVKKIKDSPAEVDYIKADNGTPNALDFQLITYLFCHLSSADQFWIVSKDTGYDAAIKMCRRLDVKNVRRAPAIKNALHFGIRAERSAALKAAKEAEKTKQAEMTTEETSEGNIYENTSSIEDAPSEENIAADAPDTYIPETADSENLHENFESDVYGEQNKETEDGNAAEKAADSEELEDIPQTDESEIYNVTDAEYDSDRTHESVSASTLSESGSAQTKESFSSPERDSEAAEEDSSEISENDSETPEKETLEASGNDSETAEAEAPEVSENDSESVDEEIPGTSEQDSKDVKEEMPTVPENKFEAAGHQPKSSTAGLTPELEAEIRGLLQRECSIDADEQQMALLGDGLIKCENKNQFYHYFRRRMGAARGSAFYKSIRGQFAAMKKIIEKTHQPSAYVETQEDE